MFSEHSSSGKHLVCDIKDIQNKNALGNKEMLIHLLDSICVKYNFTILGKLEHEFEPEGISLVYLLSESHLTIHTFPEKSYIALDLYSCRVYKDNTVYTEIYNLLVQFFGAKREIPIIVDRMF
jgi:S-adenosylmethionine decarboxylase proenzyme